MSLNQSLSKLFEYDNEQKMKESKKNLLTLFLQRNLEKNEMTLSHEIYLEALFKFLNDFNVDITDVDVCKFYENFLNDEIVHKQFFETYIKDETILDNIEPDEDIYNEVINIIFDFFIYENHVFTRNLFEDGRWIYMLSLEEISDQYLKAIFYNHQPSNKSSFLKPVQISEKIALLLNLDPNSSYNRVQITKFLLEYIKQNNLQNQEVKHTFFPDNRFKILLNIQEDKPLTYSSLQVNIQPHIQSIKEKINYKKSEIYDNLRQSQYYIIENLSYLQGMKFNLFKTHNLNGEKRVPNFAFNFFLQNSINNLSNDDKIVKKYIEKVLNINQ